MAVPGRLGSGAAALRRGAARDDPGAGGGDRAGRLVRRVPGGHAAQVLQLSEGIVRGLAADVRPERLSLPPALANRALQPPVLQLGEMETQISLLMVQRRNGVWNSCHVWLCYSAWKDSAANTDPDAH